MAFKSFRFRIVVRILILLGTLFLIVWLASSDGKFVSIILVSIILVLELIELFHFMDVTNRKLKSFLESIRYSDFVSSYNSGKSLGSSFRELDESFNGVMDAFRKAREEKEEHWQFLNTVIQHISVGIITFEHNGDVGLANTVAKRYLGTPQIRNIDEVSQTSSKLHERLREIKPGRRELVNISPQTQLSIQATEIRLKGKLYKLVSMQNIRSELQQKELDAWQNLTRVLRHEIMNSITPIASLTSTLKDILSEDLRPKEDQYFLEGPSVEDLQEGLDTIMSRSKGLVHFVDAYREYTSIPEPRFEHIEIKELLEHAAKIEKPDIVRNKVDFTSVTLPEDLSIYGDSELMELVLINLVKNALEATEKVDRPKVILMGRIDIDNSTIIEVIDNGIGIEPEALERIFVPFYTTKEQGSGIGLALSRQILQLHGGTIHASSSPGHTVFTIRFS
jgi:nitrogen fixation/metabolism regulation signal transduction histidine kinase